MSQPYRSPEIAETGVRGRMARKSDLPFFLVMGGLSASFVLLLAADVMFMSFADFRDALVKPEIRAALRLTLLSCSIAALMSLWVGTPLGYLSSRYKFPGRWLVDTLAGYDRGGHNFPGESTRRIRADHDLCR